MYLNFRSVSSLLHVQFVNSSPFKVLSSSINYIFSCLYWKILKTKVVDNLSSLWGMSYHILIILILYLFSQYWMLNLVSLVWQAASMPSSYTTTFENLEKNSSHQLIIYQKIMVYYICKRSRICITSASHASLIWSPLPSHDIKQTICRHKYYLLISKDQVSHMLNYIKY